MPVYETEADQQRELAVGNIIAAKWNCLCYPMPTGSSADFALIREPPKVAAFVEVKCRNFELGRYPTLLLPVAKAAQLMCIARASNLPVFFVCQMTDCLVYTLLKDGAYDTVLVSREGRPKDIPHFKIPTDDMQILNQGEKH